ncbi:unnamed protein product [Lepeophtheirus salmonis]|uniref:(salmon louse) hypothetical protein n=1 Tax=Lepeophtheirus salmonis TaxID=72036 RepID=A0A7R8CLV6_LEPSM|nr:unnamed protein product [Lepeophtheirus salmonis]CAF2826325.1 unnamed protein product [Lepeophtheirus salmonis]
MQKQQCTSKTRQKIAIYVPVLSLTLEKIESSEWVTHIVTVLKPYENGRICADYNDTISPVINKHLQSLAHPEELFGDLVGSNNRSSRPEETLYIDDILIYSNSIPEHLSTLRFVCDQISTTGVHLKKSTSVSSQAMGLPTWDSKCLREQFD